MNDPILTQLKNPVDVQPSWTQTFARWQRDNALSSLDYLRRLRSKGFYLSFKTIQTNCWMPTILNQVIHLNGATFLNNPLVRCFSNEVSFDIVIGKEPPYHINRLDIDVIDDLGQTEKGQTILNDLIELSDIIGCPIRISDHAEIKSTVPNTLISLINNERARTHPQRNGFAGSAGIKHSTRERIAFWRVQHQDQLIHFINDKGKINKDRIEELCEFFKNNLPNDLQDCILKLTMKEYVRTPTILKKSSLSDLMMK
jgi:hypothetical protein